MTQRDNPNPAQDRAVEVLSWLAAGTVLVALALFALQQALRLPAQFGVEDWLGWHGAATLHRTLELWHTGSLSRLPAAAAYLLLDTALFMPLYGLTLLWALRLVRGTLGPARGWLMAGLQELAVLGLLLLWAVDAIENLGGLARLDLGWHWGAAALGLAGAGLVLLRRWATGSGSGLGFVPWVLASLALPLAATGALEPLPDPARLAWIADSWLFSGWAHRAKLALEALALLPLLGLWLCWWFGLDLDSRAPGTDADVRSAQRQTALGVIGRSRYVLAVLALFAAFTLVLDQCRDLLLALASRDGRGPWVTLAISALGLALLSHACWLWTRLVGRVRRSGYAVPDLPGVPRWAGEWARSWARLLMLAPLLMAAALIANVAGDAVIAASVSPVPGGLAMALARLAAFAAAIVTAALWLMRQRRRRALPDPADYYNRIAAVRPLLHDPACMDPDQPSPPGLPWPVWQPLMALALLLAVRGAMLLMPETTGMAPPALAVLALSLVWWLGPLGLIAMAEQRAVFPWALLLLVVAGVMGFFSDNHTLPTLVIDDAAQVPSTLAALQRVALAGLLLLALTAAALWLLLTRRSRALLDGLGRRAAPGRAHALADRWRWMLCGLAVALLCAGLLGLDRWAARSMPTRDQQPQALDTPAPPDGPRLLIASEGGGVRAAYWTARVLAGLQDADPGWAARIVAMSGVSGGSMGMAVWRACLRSRPTGERAMTRCVQRGFDRLDALSPLLGGLLFEDVWMRLLPTDALCDAATGCGLRSRALGFEREWMRAFPRLAQPLGPRWPGEPDLLLNSTVVESGNRALLGTRRFAPGELPGAEDLLASGRVRSEPALVTAAHTSARFPFTNPLASLPALPASSPAAAHLVDGGYHDNSGTASLADLLTLLRQDAGTATHGLQLVLIRNGQVRTSCMAHALQQTHREPPPDCLRPSADARELLPPRDAQRLGLYADLLGPALTVVNNLGTGAHGREPVAALTARLLAGAPAPAGAGCTDGSPVCLLDLMQDASLVPLGWTLSPAARAAMDAHADTLVQTRGRAAK